MTYGMGGANPPGVPPTGMPQPGYGAPVPGYGAPQLGYGAPPVQGYEFNDEQNHLFKSLSSLMKGLGIFLIVIGILALLGGLVNVAHAGLAGAMGLVQAGVVLAIGFPLLSAAGAMQRIVTTRGNDIGFLMQAINSLRRYFQIQLIAILVAFVVGIILGVETASHMPH